MAMLRIQVNGDPGTITLRGFLAIVENSFRMLKDYDSALSGEPRGSLEWVVTNLATGSLCIEAESRSLVEDRNVGPEVVKRFINGWSLIEHQGIPPPLLSEQGMIRARTIARLLGREGVTGLEVGDSAETARVSVESATHLDTLLRVTYRSIGSVEGRIETVSTHGKPRFIIYHSRTRKAVTCRVAREKLSELVSIDMLSKSPRVSVFGIIHSNAKGEPLRIEPDSIMVLQPDENLPSRASLYGSDPEFTGEMTTDQYLRDIRSG